VVANFPAQTDPLIVGFESDPYDTGVKNGINFLSGGDPETANTDARPRVTMNGNTLTHIYRRNANASSAFFQYSTDLDEWFSIDGVTGITVTTTTDGIEPGVDEIQIDIDSTIFGECFVRQGITAP